MHLTLAAFAAALYSSMPPGIHSPDRQLLAKIINEARAFACLSQRGFALAQVAPYSQQVDLTDLTDIIETLCGQWAMAEPLPEDEELTKQVLNQERFRLRYAHQKTVPNKSNSSRTTERRRP